MLSRSFNLIITSEQNEIDNLKTLNIFYTV
jgi:hypothetical protein